MTESESESALQKGRHYVVEQGIEIWDNLGRNNLWKRILKNFIATTLLVSIALIPGARDAIGKAAYLGAITTVFGHPGRRFGQMTEALILTVAGTVLGVAWSTFGVYLGSLVIKGNPPAAYAIRGFFLAVVALFHGYLRSRAPRLFLFVLLMIIVSVVSLTSTAKEVTSVSVTQILYPILVGAGCIVLVNISIFPEFSSRFLGQMTIDTLDDTAEALGSAGQFFVEGDVAKTQNHEDARSSLDKEDKRENASQNEKSEAKDASSSQVPILKRLFSSILSNGLFTRYEKKTDVENPPNSHPTPLSIKDLTDRKAKIRQKLADCKDAQQECNFELAISVLPPRDLKPLSVTAMKKLVAHTIAVISACESKFALLGSTKDLEKTRNRKKKRKEVVDCKKDDSLHFSNPPEGPSGHFDTSKLVDEDLKKERLATIIDQDQAELDMIKPKREIEFGDARLLRYLLRRIAKPYEELHKVAARAIEVVIACVAHTYDVPTLPSGARVPSGILLEELDVYRRTLQQALVQFDANASSALEGAATMQELEGLEPDIMPREEVFLMSSFLLNLRQAVTHIEGMLKHCEELVGNRQQRHGRRRIYAPHIKWSKWLYTGGEDEAMPAPARKANKGNGDKAEDDEDDDADSSNSGKALMQKRSRKGAEKDIETGGLDREIAKEPAIRTHSRSSKSPGTANEVSRILRFRGLAADALEWTQESEDILYAVKLGVALFLVLWPAFIASWNTWYSLNRGLWAGLQLVLVTEVSIGNSFMTFFLRAIGTTLGCLWGYAALEARNGNRIVCAVMISLALFPSSYIQLGTTFPKAGMVSIVSMCIVALSTELETVPGTATENYLKRWIAFMIGGFVALLVEVVVAPVKARTRLTDSLAASLAQINEMERCIAAGIESGININIYAPEYTHRFEHASSKANTALSAAETFLPFCSTEPRIKGSFEGLALIYTEIVFVLHQIIDRMDNMLQLRTAYGSGPLEDLNADIYPYRRNVAGSITLTLFAIHSALTTKLPLPQYLPSARLAHLRLINRVREVVLQNVVAEEGHDHQQAPHQDGKNDMTITRLVRQRAVRQKYMSWNAASAAQAEIIEFVEELVELVKLLVGANEFRSGLLTRPSFGEYAGTKDDNNNNAEGEEDAEGREFTEVVGGVAVRKRRRGTMVDVNNGGRNAAAAAAAGGVAAGLVRRRRGTTVDSTLISNMNVDVNDGVPVSLRRIQSRKIEAGLRRVRTGEE